MESGQWLKGGWHVFIVITHRGKAWDVEFSELVEFSLLTRAERPKATSFLRTSAQELRR